MKRLETLYSEGRHQWLVIARDPDRPNVLIDTNEYLVVHGNEALLTDPGGLEIFPVVFAALAAGFDPRQVRWLFASHQDPDVISSLSLWLEFNPALRCYASQIWDSFLPHFGGDEHTFIGLPDAGAKIPLGGIELEAVPAHYLHSSGNLHLYDAKAKILFSGDVGAALLPVEESALFVTDFDRHIRHADGFHRRFMGSREAVLNWCERAAAMPIDLLCPQHGAIYQGADVMRFINWFSELEVGSGLRATRPELKQAA
ncbi:MAG: flavoprotein [Hydrogenophilales bacterium 28-61-23]|nr:MAG: flavoprotein [Hydrogenophilales bacterium 28-61-23]